MLRAAVKPVLPAIRAAAAPRAVAMTTMQGKWSEKQHAIEEQYFQNIDKEQRTFSLARNQFAQKLHSKELKSLLQVLPKTHNLTEADLHNLLQWKHQED